MDRKTKTARSRGRITIKDVAERAGASLKTVSRVLNNEPNVRKQTRERVLAVMRELDYRPSMSARSLAGRRSFLIGLTYGNPRPSYLVDVLSGVLDRCREEGFELLLYPFRHDDKDVVERLITAMRSSEIDGLVVTPPLCDASPVIEALDGLGLPFSRTSASSHLDHASPFVTLDDRTAARDMTDYLVALGHERIGFVKGHPNHPAAGLRLKGYRDALAAHGLAYDTGLVEPGMFALEGGREAGAKLLSRAPRPTAIFASNDESAAGVIQAAHQAGLSVPGDVSVVGFDDTYAAKFVWPPLTTVHQPTYEMAHAAAGKLLLRLRGEEDSAPSTFSHRLVIRESAAPPRKN